MSKTKAPTPTRLECKNITRDTLDCWWNILLTYCRQSTEYASFFPGNAYANWTAECRDVTRGIVVEPDPNADDEEAALRRAETQTELKRCYLATLLTTIASFAPDGMFRSITAESTSLQWIYNRIKTACNVQTAGRHLVTSWNMAWDKDSDTPDVFYMKIKSAYMESLLPTNAYYHGEQLTAPEALTPLCESLIVIRWLEAINPALPNHIMETRGHLFTTRMPNFADLQPELCTIMDTLLLEIDTKEMSQSSDATVNFLRSSQQTHPRGNHRGNFISASRFTRGNTRPTTSCNQMQSQTEVSCLHCQKVGKEESIWKSHSLSNCYDLFPHKRPQSLRFINVPVNMDDENRFDLSEALAALQTIHTNPLATDNTDGTQKGF